MGRFSAYPRGIAPFAHTRSTPSVKAGVALHRICTEITAEMSHFAPGELSLRSRSGFGLGTLLGPPSRPDRTVRLPRHCGSVKLAPPLEKAQQPRASSGTQLLRVICSHPIEVIAYLSDTAALNAASHRLVAGRDCWFVVDTGLIAALPLSLSDRPKGKSDRRRHETQRDRSFVDAGAATLGQPRVPGERVWAVAEARPATRCLCHCYESAV